MADTTTEVILVTATFVHTSLCTNAPDCPAGSTVLLTSTTVVATTTTICSTPGAVMPPVGATSTPVSSSAMPIEVSSSVRSVPSSIITTISFPGLPTTPYPCPTMGAGLPQVSLPGCTYESLATPVSTLPSSSGFSVSIITGSSIDSPSSIVTAPLTLTPAPVPSSGYASPPPSSNFGSSSSSATDAVPVPGVPSSSAYTSSSPVSGPAVPSNTYTDATHFSMPAVPSSGYSMPPASSVVTSNTYTDATHFSMPAASSSSGYNVPSSSSGLTSNTYTDATHTSFPVEPSAPTGNSSSVLAPPHGMSSLPQYSPTSSSSYVDATSTSGSSPSAGPSSPYGSGSIVTPTPTPSGSGPGYPASSAPAGTSSDTHPALRSTTSSGYGVPSLPVESTSTVDSTVRVTSYLTQTMTSVITAPPAYSTPGPNGTASSSNIEATDISTASSVSGLPSGSGYVQFPLSRSSNQLSY
jgi:hypothetical protein